MRVKEGVRKIPIDGGERGCERELVIERMKRERERERVNINNKRRKKRGRGE